LQNLDFIVERDNLVNINPDKVTTIVENDNKHFFVFKQEEDFYLAEHLNEFESETIKVKSTDPQDIMSIAEKHVENKEKIEKNLH